MGNSGGGINITRTKRLDIVWARSPLPDLRMLKLKFEDIGEYMQNYHTENNIPFNKGNKLFGSYFGKEILSYTPLLKWYLQQELKITKFHCAIK